MGGSHMALGGQAGAVEKGGVPHPQFLGPPVHLLHKGGLAPRQILRHSHGGVVARDHGDALHQLAHRHLLPLFQVDLGAAHAGGVGGDGDHVLLGDAAAVQGLEDEQQSHHLGDAGRFQLFMGRLFVEEGPGLLFHQHRGGGGEVQGRLGRLRRLPGRRRGAGEQSRRQQQGTNSLHGTNASRFLVLWIQDVEAGNLLYPAGGR